MVLNIYMYIYFFYINRCIYIGINKKKKKKNNFLKHFIFPVILKKLKFFFFSHKIFFVLKPQSREYETTTNIYIIYTQLLYCYFLLLKLIFNVLYPLHLKLRTHITLLIKLLNIVIFLTFH